MKANYILACFKKYRATKSKEVITQQLKACVCIMSSSFQLPVQQKCPQTREESIIKMTV